MVKRAKELDVKHRHIYRPESKNCEECGEQLYIQKHYKWRKRVQHLTGTAYLVNQGGCCVNEDCSQVKKVVESPEAQRLTLPGCTYGLDVIAQIGWWRDKEHLDRKEIHIGLLCKGVQLSERQVDYLYNQYQILLGCVNIRDRSRLVDIAEEHGGLKIALDGLSPEGGSEQLWVVREVESGITLVVGWLEKVNHETLKVLLGPVEDLGLPIIATVSDKQSCVKKALEEMWPDMPHQWCQPHYLGNLADPVYEQDRKLKTEMRQTIRGEVRESLTEVLEDGEGSAVHLVAGAALMEKPISPQNQPSDKESSDKESSDDDVPPSQLNISDSSVEEFTLDGEEESSLIHPDTTPTIDQQTKTIEAVVRDLASDLKEALARQGRAPFVLAGLAMMDDLTALLNTLVACLQIHEEPHLRHWADTLASILPEYTQPFEEVKTAQQWVQRISHILHNSSLTLSSHNTFSQSKMTQGEFVRLRIDLFIKRLETYENLSSWLESFRSQLIKTTQNYSAGLFHCYDIEGLPSSNNALENLFGQTKRLIRRRLGLNHIVNPLRRHAPWTLIQTAASSPEELALLFQDISYDEYRTQRSLFELRLQQLLHRFQWRHQRDSILEQRIQDWLQAIQA